MLERLRILGSNPKPISNRYSGPSVYKQRGSQHIGDVGHFNIPPRDDIDLGNKEIHNWVPIALITC